MKKIGKFMLFMVLACVIGVSGYMYGNTQNQEHVKKLENLVQEYEDQIEDLEKVNSDLTAEFEELNEQVYNMKTGEAYTVTVNHEDETHIWRSENKLFSDEIHHTIHHDVNW